MMFSFGALFAPALFTVRTRLGFAAGIAVLCFALFLLTGGLGFFIVPALYFYRMMERHKWEVIDELARPIETMTDQLKQAETLPQDEIMRLHYGLTILLQTRNEIASQSSLPPSSRLLIRSGTTLMLPIAIALIQLLSTS
ncbi:hypothetical protein [Streptomyces klenkii]|uniref:hypothetical protein n=1 Tax=Streptomyces klenkii TaxID=1420899 RepID=UPI0011C491A8|nr:hypothetical protein [Streptomyces klenkii]